MSIERNAFGFTASCDSCSHSQDIDTEFFEEAVNTIKREGWNIRRIRGAYEHSCPSCAEDETMADFD